MTPNEFDEMVQRQHQRVDEFAELVRNSNGIEFEARAIAFDTYSEIFQLGLEKGHKLYMDTAKKRVLSAATDNTLG